MARRGKKQVVGWGRGVELGEGRGSEVGLVWVGGVPQAGKVAREWRDRSAGLKGNLCMNGKYTNKLFET